MNRNPKPTDWHYFTGDGETCRACGLPAKYLTMFIKQHRAALPDEGPDVLWFKRRSTRYGWNITAVSRPRPPGPRPPKGPNDQTRRILCQAAAIVAGDVAISDAAAYLGLTVHRLNECKRRHAELWQREIDAARATRQASPQPPADAPQSPPDPPPRQATRQPPAKLQDRMRQAVRIIATGKTIAQAAEAINVKPKALYSNKRDHGPFWARELAKARAELEAAGHDVEQPAMPAEMKRNIRRASALVAAGLQYEEVAREMGLSLSGIRDWRDRCRQFWDRELDRAMEAAAVVVTKQAGTAAVLDDPGAFIRRATAAEKWARHNGRELFPPGQEPTLCSFYESFYKPNRLFEAADVTVERYEGVMRRWKLLTGDPPLKEITVETLATFRGALTKMRGLKPGTRLSPNTIRGFLTHIQAILDKAGPPGYRNRDAAGILKETPPWIKKPSPTPKPVRVVTPDELSAVYRAAVCMEIPAGLGFKPPTWWRALIVLAFNTGLRRRTLFSLRVVDVDWQHRWLSIPPQSMKSKRAEVKHLNPTALQHLMAIRTDRELVFPWPHCMGCFHTRWHRLLTEAGIPRQDHFGLHDLRKTLATMLWEQSPQAAQFVCGHVDESTTRGYYVEKTGIEARALDAIPQPAAFTQDGRQAG